MSLNRFCGGSPFWDLSITWNTYTPDFTPCFHQTALVWIPCAFLWFFATIDIYRIRSHHLNTARTPWTLVAIFKLILGLLLIAISFCELIDGLINRDLGGGPVRYYTPFIRSITLILAMALQSLNRRRAINSSGVLFVFWLLMTVGEALTYRSVLMHLLGENSFNWQMNSTLLYGIRLSMAPLLLAQLLLNCFSDRLPIEYVKPGADIKRPSPELNSAFLSQLFFWWMNPIIVLGYKRPLEMSDMYTLREENTTTVSVKEFQKNFNYHKEKKANLLLSLGKTYWSRLVILGLYKLVASVLTFAAPTILQFLLNWLVDPKAPFWHGYIFLAAIFGAAFFESMFNNQYEYNLGLVGLKMRAAIQQTLHQKALRMSSSAKTIFSSGEIVNLMAVDTQRVVDYLNFVNMWWVAPLQIAISLFLLWQQLGVASLAGMSVMALLLPVNGYIGKRLRIIHQNLMKFKDRRTKVMSEILNGIKILKLYAWEIPFNKKISSNRNEELKELDNMSYMMGYMTFTFGCTPIFVAIISFLTYTMLGGGRVLDASKAFVSLSLFNLVRIPLAQIPMLMAFSSMFVVSRDRLEKFLNCDEMDQEESGHEDDMSGNPIQIESASFSWSSTDNEPCLKDLNVHIKEGQLVAVVGQVGSGKSSLIAALLGDMERISGRINISGQIAYVPQQAWIQNSTLRDNVSFINPYDERKYNKTIADCALEEDLKMLPGGSDTEIGEKGINLSGGQKQRVSLARAVYADTDVYLLDDPLSAVDSHVGKHLFDKVIGPEGSLKRKTRVLVTHKISVQPKVDEIIVMKDGKISEQGSYLELMKRKGHFSEFIIEHLADKEGPSDDEDDEELEKIKEMVRPELERAMSRRSETASKASSDGSYHSRSRRKSSIYARQRSRVSTVTEKSDKTKEAGQQPKKSDTAKLIEAEGAATGSVKMSVYIDYIMATGKMACLLILVTNLISYALNIGGSLWLTQWSNDAYYPERTNDTQLRNTRIGVYGGLGISEAIFMFVANLTLFIGTLKASKLMHDQMLEHILRAPMSFFDTTPLGRILNRFSKDIDSTDIQIRMGLRQFFNTFFRTLVSIIVIAISSPLFLAPAIPLGIVYYFVQKYYIESARQIRRLESNSRSPIYSHFGEAVFGSSSIRAYGAVDTFNKECQDKIDYNHGCYAINVASQRWLAVRLEILGNTIVLLAALLGVLSKGNDNPAATGMAISYALTITTNLNLLVRATAELEMSLISVERILEYTRTPVEAPAIIESTRPPNVWPDKGLIAFNNYSTRYREGLDLVLNQIRCEIEPTQKVGIVGRTGAGKSSLTLALFRLIEPAAGTILIDGLDVSKMGLFDLRSKLSIIPQDPVLFTGSLRLNLDPFNNYTDQEIWHALALAHLKDFVTSLETGLEHEITEGGENLSVGQRQLVCLARALLRKSKILVLDEATAAVDLETDDLIQNTIRTEFVDCTIITIAHRLNTILDYDKILVMDKGTVAEYDTPSNLLDKTDSIFHSMAKDAGLLSREDS